jgi:hypothetical protein
MERTRVVRRVCEGDILDHGHHGGPEFPVLRLYKALLAIDSQGCKQVRDSSKKESIFKRTNILNHGLNHISHL